MGDTFCEELIPCKIRLSEILIRAVCVMGCLLLLGLVGILGQYGIYVLVLEFFAIYGTIIVWKNTNIEYEYAYLNGRFTIDKIYGKNRRKFACQFDLKDAELVAHEDSHRLDYHLNNPNFRITDYSSGYEADNRYVVVVGGKNGADAYGVFVELSSEMLEAIYHDAPSKVHKEN
ncbi:MAG: hypothetical protein E7269_05975 [Lachnospiraceae bacterium]|nr:hypothetical protein [Lachnospiraceae bacterium]